MVRIGFSVKKGLAVLLSLIMLIAILPVSAIAEELNNEEPTVTEEPVTEEPVLPETEESPEPSELPETTPEPLPPADREVEIDDAFTKVLDHKDDQYTLRLNVKETANYCLTVTGAVAWKLKNEQTESTESFASRQGEDGLWQDTTAELRLVYGSYYVVFTALDENIEFSWKTEKIVETIVEPERTPDLEPVFDDNATPAADPTPEQGEPSTATFVMRAREEKLTDILNALDIALSENNYDIAVDSDAVTLSGDKVKPKDLEAFTLTAVRFFEQATLTLESKNGKDSHTIVLSYPAPAPIEVTFESSEDYVMLLALLREHGVETVAVDDAAVVEGDDTAIELTDYIGDYMVAPVKHFESVKVSAVVREGFTYTVIFRYPKQLEEQTVEVSLPESLSGTEMTVSGLLPEEAEVTVETVSASDALDADAVMLSVDITIENGFQPTEPVTVTVKNPAIAAAIEAGKQIVVVHTADDGTLEAAEIVYVNGDTVAFKASHFSQFDIIGSVFGELAKWANSLFEFTLKGLSFLNPKYTQLDSASTLEEGLELESGYHLEFNPISAALAKLANLTVSVKNTNLSLGEREGVVVYGLNNSTITDTLAENPDESEQIALGDANGFAVVKDSGYRHKSFDFETVTLDGMMPKAADASAETAELDPINNKEVLAAYDISIVEDGVAYQPDSEHPIHVEILNENIDPEKEIGLVHIHDDGTVEPITDFTVEDGKVSFDASGFSVYAVIGEDPGTDEPQYGRRWYYFELDENTPFNFTDNNGTDINYLIVHNGDYLQNPGTPSLTEHPEYEFLGWYKPDTNEGYTFKDEDRIDFVESDGRQLYGPITDISETQNEEVHLRARFANAHTVTFMDETGSTIVRTERVPNGDTIRLTRESTDAHYTIYTPQKATDVFLGWSTQENQTALTVTELTVTEDVTLYPVIAPAHWIVFYTGPSGSGAEYIGDQHWTADESLIDKTLPVPKYPGYTFGGWFTLENGGGTMIADASGAVQNQNLSGNIVVGGETKISNGNLVADITLYAKWTPKSDTQYTVIFWVQRNTDAVGLSNAAKKYDYLGAITRTETTGATVPTTAADRQLTTKAHDGIDALGNYFTYNSAKSDTSAMVKGDGSTVLNVYYDRKTITINFYNNAYVRTYGTSYSNDPYSYYFTTTEHYYGYVSSLGAYLPLTLGTNNPDYYPLSGGYVDDDYATWTFVYGGTAYSYSGSIYVLGKGSTITTQLKGLYGAQLNNWPSAGTGSRWHYIMNGSDWYLSLPWTQYIIAPDPDNDTTYWELWPSTKATGAYIHYMGETIEYPTSFDPMDMTTANGSYYENFTMNPYNYYGEYNARVTDTEKALYYAVTGKNWPNQALSASQLKYNDNLANDEMGTGSTVTVNNSLFNGYVLVGYSYGKVGTDSYAVWHSVSNSASIPLVASNNNAASNSEQGDLYVYYARARETVDIYSDFTTPKQNSYKMPYGLRLNPLKDWRVLIERQDAEGKLPIDYGYNFSGWYWDEVYTKPVDWSEDVTVPATSTKVYAGWDVREYVIELDYNGGTTQTRQDTVFWLDHGQTIPVYANTKREYVLWDSLPQDLQTQLSGLTKYRYHHFVYVNEAGDGYVDGTSLTPGDYSKATQNAFFAAQHSGVVATTDSTWYVPKKAEYYEVTDANQNTVQTYWDRHNVDENGYTVTPWSRDLTYYDNGLYVKISDIQTALTALGSTADVPGYRLVGWYEVDKETGRLADYPFDFSTPVKRNITLRAIWIRTGSYKVEFLYKDSNVEYNNKGFYVTDNDTRIFFDVDQNGERTNYHVEGASTEIQNPDDGKKYSDQALVVVPAAPETNPTTEKFIGWRINGKVYYPGDTFRLDSDLDPLVDGTYNQVIVLEAVYGNIEKSSITFDGNGGTYVGEGTGNSNYGNPSYTITGITENDVVMTPTAERFRRPNYTLIGWARESGATEPDFLPGVKVAVNGRENTLYAVWERTYSVTYNPNGGGGTLTDPTGLVDNQDGTYSTIGIKYNASTTASNGTGFTRDGYAIVGWNSNQTAANNGTVQYALGATISNIRENITLYAVWELRFSVTYDANRGSGVLTDPTGLTNDGAGHFTTGPIFASGNTTQVSNGSGLSRDGFEFIGWNTAADGNGTSSYAANATLTVNGNVTLYAQWRKLLSIRYLANGGSGTLTNGGSYTYTENGTTQTVNPTPSDGVVFNIPYGSRVTLSNGDSYTREGYTLKEWNTASDGTGTSYAKGENAFTSLEDNVVLYAIWEPKLHVIYNVNGGVGTLRNLASTTTGGEFTTGNVYESDDSVTTHDGRVTDGTLLRRPGYRLVGWNTAADGSGTSYALDRTDAFTITEDTKLYAEWVELYEITYHPNGGGGSLSDGGKYTFGTETVNLTPNANVVSEIPKGSTVTLSLGTGFERYGYGIKGWSTVQSRTSAEWDPARHQGEDFAKGGEKTNLTSNMTLYAIWDAAWTVVFDPRGGNWTDTTVGYTVGTGDMGPTYSTTVIDGDTVHQPTNPTKDDGNFVFWSTNKDANPEEPATYGYAWNTQLHTHIVLYAIYSKAVKVTFDVNGGTWDSGNDTDYYVQSGANYVATVNLGAAVNEPIDPSYTGKVFIGWVEQSKLDGLLIAKGVAKTNTDWSGTTAGYSGSSTTYANDLAWIKANTYDFSSLVTQSITLVAVWSETVTVTFDLRARGSDGEFYGEVYDPYTYHHTWGSGNDSSYYVFRSAEGNNGYWEYVVTIPKGDTVRQPSDPTMHTSTRATGFLYWTTTEYYYWGGYGGSKYYSYEIYAEPSYITRYDFSQPVLTDGLRLYTSWLSSISMFDVTVNVTKTLTDSINQNAGTFEFPYTIRTYRYRAVRGTSDGTTTATLETDGYNGQPASVSSVLELTTTANSGTSSTATGSITLHYWPDYGTENGTNYEYLYFEVLEIAEDISENYTLSITRNNGNAQGFSEVTNGRIYAPFQLTQGMTFGRESYNYNRYFTLYWRYDNSHYFVNYDSYYDTGARTHSGWFSNTSATASTTAPSVDTTITFTNTRKYVDVTVGKTVVRHPNNETVPGTFVFTVALSDNGEDRTDALPANYKTFQIANGGSYVLHLPVGSVLTVTETGENGGSGSVRNYYTSASASTNITEFYNDGYMFNMTVPSTAGTVTVTNQQKPPAVKVTLNKTLIDPLTTGDTFTLTLALKRADGNPYDNWNIVQGKETSAIAGETTDANGVITFTGVGNAWTKDVMLPPNMSFTITETGEHIENYDIGVASTAVDTSMSFGGVMSGATYLATVPECDGTITFTNTRKTANVEVTKTFDGGTAADNRKVFTFDVTLYKADGTTAIANFDILNGAANAASGDGVTGNDGKTTFTITGANVRTIKVPVGAKLVLSEDLAAHDGRYTVRASGNRGVWDANAGTYTIGSIVLTGDRVLFINTRRTVQVVIHKVVNDPISTGSESFGFKATLTDDGRPVDGYAISGTKATVDGVYEFNLVHSGSETLTIPYGAVLTVEENSYRQTFLDNRFDACPYDTTATINNGGAGTVSNATYTLDSDWANSDVTFTNTRKTVTVTVYKTTVDPLYTGKEFTFEGTISTMANELLSYYDMAAGVQRDQTYYNNYKDTNPLITNAEGYVTFTIKNGVSKALKMPAGVKLVGRETNAGLYRTTIDYAGVNISDAQAADIKFDLSSVGSTGWAALSDLAGIGLWEPENHRIRPDHVSGTNPKEYASEIPPWDCAIWFTNTKPYVPVTVNKTVNDPIKSGEQTYTFKVAMKDREGNAVPFAVNTWNIDTDTGLPATSTSTNIATTTVTLVNGGEYATFTVTVAADANTGSTTLYLPTGAEIAIEEIGAAQGSNSIDLAAFVTTVNLNGGANYPNRDITIDNLNVATTVNYTNTRRTVPVKIIKVDDSGNPLTGASFELRGGKLASSSLSTSGSSLVFDGTLYQGDSITLEETAKPTNYNAAHGTVTINVSDTGTVTSDASSYGGSVEYDLETETWFVKVQNTRGTHTVNVAKTLNDLLVASQSFGFVATLTEADGITVLANYPIGGAGVTTDANGQYAFTIGDVANGGTKEISLTVPEGATLTVQENDTFVKVYDTSFVQEGSQGTDYDLAHSSPNQETRTAQFANIKSDNCKVTFTNTRKSATVFIKKTLNDILAATDQTFSFKAELFNTDGTTPLTAYTGDGFSNAEKTVTISLEDTDVKSEKIVIPIGAKLCVTEQLSDDLAKAYTTEVNFNGQESKTITGETVTGRTLDGLVQVDDQEAVYEFVNTRRTVTITLKKILNGTYNEAFPFTVTLSARNYNSEGFENGVRTFNLVHEQEETLIIPKGVKITIEEGLGVDYYVESIVATQSVGKVNLALGRYEYAANADNEVTFTNCILPAPTGFESATAPFVWTMMIGLCLAAGIMIPVLRKRRKEEE